MNEIERIIRKLYKPETAEAHLKALRTMRYEDLPKIPWKREDWE